MKITATMTAIAGLMICPAAFAADKNPANVQDPPGSVSVDQPAGVTLEQRDTAQDTTDTMHGATTAVIESKTATEGQGVQWRELQPGEEARAAFSPTESEVGTTADAASPGETMPGTASSDDTWLGTDLGYGTATESVPTPSR